MVLAMPFRMAVAPVLDLPRRRVTASQVESMRMAAPLIAMPIMPIGTQPGSAAATGDAGTRSITSRARIVLGLRS